MIEEISRVGGLSCCRSGAGGCKESRHSVLVCSNGNSFEW